MEKSYISNSFSGGDIELRDHFALELMEGAVFSSLKWLFLSFMIQLYNSFKPHRLGKCIFINTNGYIAVSLSTLMCLLPLTPIYQLSHYCFEQRYHFGKKYWFFAKKIADISKIKKVLVLKGIFSQTTCVYTYVTYLKFVAYL